MRLTPVQEIGQLCRTVLTPGIRQAAHFEGQQCGYCGAGIDDLEIETVEPRLLVAALEVRVRARCHGGEDTASAYIRMEVVHRHPVDLVDALVAATEEARRGVFPFARYAWRHFPGWGEALSTAARWQIVASSGRC